MLFLVSLGINEICLLYNRGEGNTYSFESMDLTSQYVWKIQGKLKKKNHKEKWLGPQAFPAGKFLNHILNLLNLKRTVQLALLFC